MPRFQRQAHTEPILASFVSYLVSYLVSYPSPSLLRSVRNANYSIQQQSPPTIGGQAEKRKPPPAEASGLLGKGNPTFGDVSSMGHPGLQYIVDSKMMLRAMPHRKPRSINKAKTIDRIQPIVMIVFERRSFLTAG